MKNKKLIFTILIILILIGLFYVLYKFTNTSEDTSYTDDDGIIYQEATDEEKEESDAIKQEHVDDEQDQQDSPDNNQVGSVNPVISAWSQDEEGNLRINGFVPGVIETQGTCTYTLVKDNDTVKKSREALINAQNTSCGQTTIAKSELNNGEWKITLHYKSPSSEGTSDEKTIQIN